MIDIQGGADLIPLLPFVAIFAALAVVYLLKGAAALLARKRPSFSGAAIYAWGSASVLAVILVISIGDQLLSKRDQSLKAQDTEVAQMVSYSQSGDKLYVHGQTEILVLSGLTNASRYYLLDRGKDEYLDRILAGGFTGWLQTLKEERPKIVVLNRMKTLLHKNEFFDWVREDYVMRKDRFFIYYVRKDAAGDIPASQGGDEFEEENQSPDDN